MTKRSGEESPFNRRKLELSLRRSGANEAMVHRVADEIENSLHDKASTQEIYKKAFAMLRKGSRHMAARYNLKKALYDLGPTGYPFEHFIAEILRHQGFETQVDVIVQGQCVNHEVDVVAHKDKKHFMIECKFHSDQSRFCDVKVPLYIDSRFRDIDKKWMKEKQESKRFHEGWIFTNTRFTSDAIDYGNCCGLKLVGWNYPPRNGLKERVDALGLHPITSLTTLTQEEKSGLLENKTILCKELCLNPEVLDLIGMSTLRKKRILEEAQLVCNL